MEEGDRIAQLIIERIYNPDVLEVDVSLSPFTVSMNAEKILRTSKKLFEERVDLDPLEDMEPLLMHWRHPNLPYFINIYCNRILNSTTSHLVIRS